MGDLILWGGGAFLVWLCWPGSSIGGGDVIKPFKVDVKKPNPADVLAPLVAATPTPGRFYQLYLNAPNASGNGGLLDQALSKIDAQKGNVGSLRLDYLDHMTRGWNVDLYSRNEPADGWGPAYNFRGVNLSPAWLPRHVNAVESIAGGHVPVRAISDDGGKLGLGNSFGLLWLPELDEAALVAGAVVIKQREDGSDPYYPPKELMDLLTYVQ